MKTPTTSVIECLESKIAPAGTVAAVIAGGVLSLTGTLDNNEITITETTPDQFSITGAGGTLIKLGADPAVASLTFSQPIHTIKVDLQEGNDVVTLVNVDLTKDLTVNQGIGNNTTNLNGVTIGGKVLVQGGSGDDTVNINTAFHVGGNASFTLGDGANIVQESAVLIMVQGALNYTGGNSTDTLNLGPSGFMSFGSVKVQGGSGAGTFVLSATVDLTIYGAVSMTSLDHLGVTVSMGIASSAHVHVAGAVSLVNGGGNNIVSLGASDSFMVAGALSIKNGNASTSGSVSINASAVTVEGGLTIKNGNGNFTNSVLASFLDVNGSVSITNGNTGGGTTSTSLSGSLMDISGGLSISNGNGTFTNSLSYSNANLGGVVSFKTLDSMSSTTSNSISSSAFNSAGVVIVNGDGLFSNSISSIGGRIAGNVSITQGDSIGSSISTTISLPQVTGSIAIKNGDGDFNTSLSGGNLILGGSLSIKNGEASVSSSHSISVGSIDIDGGITINNANGTVSTTISATNIDVKGAVAITNGNASAPLSVSITASEMLRIGGNFSLKNGEAPSDTSVTSALTHIGGNVNVFYGGQSAGTSTLDIGNPAGSLYIKGGFTFKSLGGATDTNVEANTTYIGGAVSVITGDAADKIDMVGLLSFISGSVTISNGTGASQITLGSNGGNTIKGNVSFNSLAGDDTWLIAGTGRITGSVSANPGTGATGSLGMVASSKSLEIGGSVTANFASMTGDVAFSLSRVVVLGGVTVTGGSGEDTVNVVNSSIRGAAAFNMGADVDTFSGVSSSFLGAFSLLTGSGASGIILGASQFSGAFSLQTGAEIDTLSIQDSQFRGIFSAQMGAGADIVNVETDAGQTGRTIFHKAATFLLGDGGDTMVLAGNVAARTAEFKAAATVNGGDGTDSLTQGTQVIGAVSLVSVP